MGLHERGLVIPSVSFAELLAGDRNIQGTTTFGLSDYIAQVVASGFPGIMGAAPRLRRALLAAYLDRVIDRDLPEAGFGVRRPETLRRWLSAYAAASSMTTAYSNLLDATTGGDGSQPTRVTTLAYRDHLTRLWLLDPVPGWLPASTPIRRLQQAPKHQLADPALAVSLLGLTEAKLLTTGAQLAGPLFESLVTLGVRILAQAAEAKVYHLRTNAGEHEVDLIVEGADGTVLGIEVKLAGSVSDSDVRHLRWLRDQIPGRVANLVVITTGPQAYVRADGVIVLPLAMLG